MVLAGVIASLFGSAGSSTSVWQTSSGPAAPGSGHVGGGMHSKLLAQESARHDAGHAKDMMSVDAGLEVHRDAAENANDIVKQLILQEEAAIEHGKKGPGAWRKSASSVVQPSPQ